MDNKLVSEFGVAYSNARASVQQGSVEDARRDVVVCLQLLVVMYKNSSAALARAKILALANKLKGVLQILRTQGITAEVKRAFDIVSGAQYAPIATAPSNTTSDSGRVSTLDDLIALMAANIEQSQEWLTNMFEKKRDSVVRIRATTGGKGSSGTGFVVSPNGFLLTNHHVVYDEDTRTYHDKIIMQTKDEATYELQLIDADAQHDVALCRYDVTKVPTIPPIEFIEDYSQLKQGNVVFMIGYTFSEGFEPIKGEVRFTRDSSGDLVYTVPSNHGDSGGPVMTRTGLCVGINKSETKSIMINGKEREANAMHNATPVDTIRELLAKWSTKNNLNI